MAETPEEIERIERLLEEHDKARSKWAASNLSEVAEFFGLNIQTVKQWRMESPPMPGGEGFYPLDQIVKWRHAKLMNSDISTAQKQATLEATQLQNESRRLEIARERGELLDRTEVERWAATALIETREMVMSLPEMLATSSPPDLRDFVRAESDRHCRDVLMMLRRKLETKQIEITGNEVSGASTTDQVS